LDFAIAGGNLEILRILEEKGVNFRIQCLSTAAMFHRTEVFEWLIEQKGLDVRGSIEVTNSCAMGSSLEILLNCIELGCPVNYPSVMGPLHRAARSGCADVVALLLGHKYVNANALANDILTPLDEAVGGGRMRSLHILLSSQKVDPNVANKDGVFFDFTEPRFILLRVMAILTFSKV
jgi:ankyrin repeat protein